MFAELGRFSYRHRWWVLAVWLVVLVAGITLGGQVFDRLRTLDGLSADAESMVADRQIKDLVSDGPVMLAVIGGRQPYDPPLVASVTAAVADVKKVQGVVDVDSLYTSPGGRIGQDNTSTLVTVEFAENLAEPDLEAAEDTVRARLKQIDAPTVLVGGDHLAKRAFGDQAVRDLAVSEGIAFGLLLVALVVFFGGVIAAGIPLAVAITGVSATLLVLLGITTLTDVGDYSVNIVTLLGLGLAVDYALLIVARFREERAGGAELSAAVETALARAGRAVAISGAAVAVALAGLSVFAEPLLSSMALGGAVIAVLTTALALTAGPALLAVVGGRIPPAGAQTWVTRAVDRVVGTVAFWRRRGQPAPARPRADRRPARREPLLVRLATLAQRQPVAVALATLLGLVVLAVPVAFAHFGNSDARALPASLEERQAYESYRGLFGNNQAAPVTIVGTVDSSSPQLRDYLNELLRQPQVFRLDLRKDVPPGAVIVDIVPKGVTDGAESRELVTYVREHRPGFPVRVAGASAEVLDYQESVGARLPFVVVMIVIAMLALLYLLTRSVVVPVKAVVLNAVTFVATLGVLVPIFQWGWGEPVLRFDSWGGLDLTTPLLLFVFIFGLSMDYEVFLLARIKEEYERRPDNDAAVLAGIRRSGPVVTAAAICITIVFLGFAAGQLVAVKEIGVGMAVAVILDVTVVRGLLLPATMSLLGDLNWWPRTPRPQRRPGRRPAPATVGK